MSATSRARRAPRRAIAVAAVLTAGAIASGSLWRIGAQAFAVGVGVLTLGASLAFAVLLVRKQLRGEMFAAASDAREDRYRLAVATALEIRCTASIVGRFPEISMPQSGYSMTSANLVGLLDVLITLRPRMVVELGSGFSTLLIAAWLKREGEGRLVSFDHDPYWAEKCRAHLRMQGLDRHAEVRQVSLAPRQVATERLLWYDLERDVGDVTGIDLLVVDGPPSQPGQTTRSPALPVFHDRLSHGAAIFVDDGNRTGERAMVEGWMREFPGFSSHYTSTLTGYWVLHREPAKS